MYIKYMKNILLVSILTSSFYFIFSFLKTKYADKEELDIKKIVLHTLFVSISSYVAFYIVFNYNLGNDNVLKEVREIPAFTGSPGF